MSMLKLKLYRVAIIVTPTQYNPVPNKEKPSFLFIYLFDETYNSATDRADAIAGALPYKIASPIHFVSMGNFLGSGEQDAFAALTKSCTEQAWCFGFAIHFLDDSKLHTIEQHEQAIGRWKEASWQNRSDIPPAGPPP
jgi:hypothetical protein